MRTSRDELYDIASDDLSYALGEIGLAVTTREKRAAITFDGKSIELNVHPATVASASIVNSVIEACSTTGLNVLVADRISSDARRSLDTARWSWFDRRGEISVRIGTYFLVRQRVSPKVRLVPQGLGPVRSRAGLAYLATALERPGDRPVIRAVARRAGLSHVAISVAKTKLHNADLIDASGRAIQHVTFEALSESWVPQIVALSATPTIGRETALEVNINRPELPGWALTDTLAALAWGASIPVTANYPPDFVVPTQRAFSRSIHVLGTASTFDLRAGTICVAPLPFATDHRYKIPGVEHLVTHPLYAALAIARDRTRGIEILAAWQPQGPTGFQPSW